MKINSNWFTDLKTSTNPQNSQEKACGLGLAGDSLGKIYNFFLIFNI